MFIGEIGASYPFSSSPLTGCIRVLPQDWCGFLFQWILAEALNGTA